MSVKTIYFAFLFSLHLLLFVISSISASSGFIFRFIYEFRNIRKVAWITYIDQ